MRNIVAGIVVIPFFILGCGMKSDGGFNRTNDYETRTLVLEQIGGSYTLDPDEGLNFTLLPAVATGFSAYFYSKDGNLSDQWIEMDADNSFSCSEGSLSLICNFDNNDTVGYTFSLANRANDPLSFKVVAYRVSLSEGSSGAPLGINEGDWVNGQVGSEPSYYAFAKEGSGKVEISVKEKDTMTDSAEKIEWELTQKDTGASINVTDSDSDTNSTCQDAYSDENISCTTDEDLTNGVIYRLKVENAGETALVKYKILVTPR